MRIWIALLVLVAACAQASPEAGALQVAPGELMLFVGATSEVTATSDTGDVATIAWDSSNIDVATVDDHGDGTATITALAPGAATITARLGPVERDVAVTVGDTAIDRIDVVPAAGSTASLAAGRSTQLVATGHFTDGTTQDVSDRVAWTSSDEHVASVTAGMVTTHATGAVTISATAAGIAGNAGVQVTAAELVTIAVSSAPAPLANGLTTQLTATGTYTDGTMANLTATATWTSRAPDVATVDHGLVHAVAATGSADVEAAQDGVRGTTTIAAAPAVVTAIAIGPTPLSLALGVTTPLTATGTFSDGTSSDITSSVTWAAFGGNAVSVSAAGVAHAAAQGDASVSATRDAVTAQVTAHVGPAVAASLAITSGDITLAQHQRAHLRAVLTFTDGTTEDAGSAAWSSNSAAVTATSSVVDAQATAGSATIQATASGFTASITATVTTTACHPVINEVQAGGASAGDEWVEVYNPCTVAISVASWTLDYRAKTTVGSSDTNQLAALAGTMPPGELRLYVGPAFSGTQTPDGLAWGGANGLLAGDSGALGLRSGPKDTGALIDSVCYGAVTAGHPFLEGSSAPGLSAGKSVTRARFDGNDTNVGANDFVLSAAPTPKQLAVE